MQPALQGQLNDGAKATATGQRGNANSQRQPHLQQQKQLQQQEQQLLQQFVAKIQIGTFVEELRSLSPRLRHRLQLRLGDCICVCAVRIYGLAGVTAKWDNIC